MIRLHKKGDINDPNNYRGVCLLAMGSRILARIMADRLRIWSEKLQLLDDCQAGFRSGRSTADITQVMVRIWEDTEDLKSRMLRKDGRIDEDRVPEARLLDLKKAYPRVSKPALWNILEKYGMGEKCLRVLQDLHEGTEYRIKSREGESTEWIPLRGLREGCPSSPPSFNIFHQVPMRLASKEREMQARQAGGDSGIGFRYIPGNYIPGVKCWEKVNSETRLKKVDTGLFADDTSGIGKRAELEAGMIIVKDNMKRVEEKNN